MPGTGIHGYTGTSSSGKYNIVNGIIQSAAPSTDANNINHSTSASTAISNAVNAVANNIQSAVSTAKSSNLAAAIAGTAGTGTSDYADMIREILSETQKNTAMSQAFAREQMDYQTKSDQTAMAWSAQEAQKNRDWQEQLSNEAHQREVRDLIAAGLNPILSANNGAYTGSGATGQGFSSSGAMGQVDTSSSSVIGQLFSNMMTNASNAYIAGLYTDAERYSADLQYSSSRLATEASILNNQNSTSAQKSIASAQMANDLERTRIQGEYGLQNTGLSGEYSLRNTELNTENQIKTEQMRQEGQTVREMYSQQQQNKRNTETNQTNERMNTYKVDYGSLYSMGAAKTLGDLLVDVGEQGVNAFYALKEKYEKRGKPNPILNKIFGYN